MLARQGEANAAGLVAPAAALHRGKEFITGDLVDRARPAARFIVDARDLLFAEAIDAATRALEPQRQVLARLVFLVWLQGNDMVALVALAQGLETSSKGCFTE